MTLRPSVLTMVAIAALLPACGRSPVPLPSQPATASPPRVEPGRPAPASWPLEMVDGLGRKVVLARPAGRVISLAPSNSEILFAVGAGDRVVGRTSVDDYPPEVGSIASIGGMTPKGMNLEAIVALRADLVLATCGVQEPIVAPIERLGLTVVALDAQDFEGVAKNIRQVGLFTDHVADADRLARQFLDRVEAVRRRVASRRPPRPRVLYLVREEPLMTAGPATFIGQMIETAGGINVFGDVSTRYPRPSEEEILARMPDVIVTAYGAMSAGQRDDEARRARIRARPGWGGIPAVRDGRIAFLQEDRVTRPGPRLVEGLEEMADALEPAPPKSPVSR
jgi:iron complex transport system substrate-binding protein